MTSINIAQDQYHISDVLHINRSDSRVKLFMLRIGKMFYFTNIFFCMLHRSVCLLYKEYFVETL